MYKIKWKLEAEEDLKRIDPVIAKKLVEKVENYLAKNPTA
jgi:mRNA-degrading endonuclease RelE of RelBE toxin-antitoxin system